MQIHYSEIRKDYYDVKHIRLTSKNSYVKPTMRYGYNFERCFSNDTSQCKTTPILTQSNQYSPLIIKNELKEQWQKRLQSVCKNNDISLLVSIEKSKRTFENTLGISYHQDMIWCDLILSYRPQSGRALFVSDGCWGIENVGSRVDYLSTMVTNVNNEASFIGRKTITTSGFTTLMLSPTVSAVIFHELFGHGLEEHSHELFNTVIGSNKLSISAYLPNRHYDDEGVISKEIDLIKEGRVVAKLYDRNKKMKMLSGLSQAGNTGVEPHVRLTHLRVHNGSCCPKQLLSSVNVGIYCSSISSAQYCNNSAIVRVNYARIIRNGHLGELVKDFCFILPFNKLDESVILADDSTRGQSGRCIKYADPLPTETFSPTVLLDKVNVFYL